MAADRQLCPSRRDLGGAFGGAVVAVISNGVALVPVVAPAVSVALWDAVCHTQRKHAPKSGTPAVATAGELLCHATTMPADVRAYRQVCRYCDAHRFSIAPRTANPITEQTDSATSTDPSPRSSTCPLASSETSAIPNAKAHTIADTQ